MKNYHAVVHDKETRDIIFEAQVQANNPGEAQNKIALYLLSIDKIGIFVKGAMHIERGDRPAPDIPFIE